MIQFQNRSTETDTLFLETSSHELIIAVQRPPMTPVITDNHLGDSDTPVECVGRKDNTR